MSRTYRHAPYEVQLHQNRRRERGRKRLAVIPFTPAVRRVKAFGRDYSQIVDPDPLEPIEAFKHASDLEAIARGLTFGVDHFEFERTGSRYHGYDHLEPGLDRRDRRNAAHACRMIARDPEQWFDHEVV